MTRTSGAGRGALLDLAVLGVLVVVLVLGLVVEEVVLGVEVLQLVRVDDVLRRRRRVDPLRRAAGPERLGGPAQHLERLRGEAGDEREEEAGLLQEERERHAGAGRAPVAVPG